MDQPKKFEQLDAFRFFAVFGVMVAHWHVLDQYEKVPFLFGTNGVNLFFALSGFLITLILIRTKEQRDFTLKSALKNFYIRRGLRIFPVYYILLLALWFFNHNIVKDGIWWYLTYTANFYCIKLQEWCRLSHLWSLSLEEQFYLIWPFIILLTPIRKLWIPISVLIIGSIVSKVVMLQNGIGFWVVYLNPLSVMDILGLGALLAYCYHFYQERLRSLLGNVFISLLIWSQFAIVVYLMYQPGFENFYLWIGRFSFGLVAVWLVGRASFGFSGLTGKILLLRPLQYLGKITYGLYLFHLLVPGMLLGLKHPENVWLRAALYLAVTIAISTASWFLLEKRILALKENFH